MGWSRGAEQVTRASLDTSISLVGWFSGFSGGDDMKHYEVALWHYWPSLWPDYIEVVIALSARLAVYEVMQQYSLHYVEKVAVVEIVERPGALDSPIRCWRGVAPTERWYGVICPKQQEEMI